MRHDFRLLATFAVTTLSGLGLLACTSDTDPSPEPPDLSHADVHHYRITSIEVPTTFQALQDSSFDLDGDGNADNRLGAAYASMQQQDSLYEVEAPSSIRLTDDIGWVLSIYDGRNDGFAAVRIARGVVTGGHALPLDEVEPAYGDALGPTFTLTGGQALVPLGILTDALGDAEPGWIASASAVTAISVESFDRDTARIKLGLALPSAEIRPVLVANLAAFFTTALAAGRSDYGHAIDRDQDGVVTQAELEADPLFAGLVAPDITTDDGDAVSLGIWLDATTL